jgi:hypothetical protein
MRNIVIGLAVVSNILLQSCSTTQENNSCNSKRVFSISIEMIDNKEDINYLLLDKTTKTMKLYDTNGNKLYQKGEIPVTRIIETLSKNDKEGDNLNFTIGHVSGQNEIKLNIDRKETEYEGMLQVKRGTNRARKEINTRQFTIILKAFDGEIMKKLKVGVME